MRFYTLPDWTPCSQVSCVALAICVMLGSFQVLAQSPARESAVKCRTRYRTIRIDGFSTFYREAGPKEAPTLLLLHGFPSSSRMFEPLFARPFDQYHLVAPDYPGFGHSAWPDRSPNARTLHLPCRGYSVNAHSRLPDGARVVSRSECPSRC